MKPFYQNGVGRASQAERKAFSKGKEEQEIAELGRRKKYERPTCRRGGEDQQEKSGRPYTRLRNLGSGPRAGAAEGSPARGAVLSIGGEKWVGM